MADLVEMKSSDYQRGGHIQRVEGLSAIVNDCRSDFTPELPWLLIRRF